MTLFRPQAALEAPEASSRSSATLLLVAMLAQRRWEQLCSQVLEGLRTHRQLASSGHPPSAQVSDGALSTAPWGFPLFFFTQESRLSTLCLSPLSPRPLQSMGSDASFS